MSSEASFLVLRLIVISIQLIFIITVQASNIIEQMYSSVLQWEMVHIEQLLLAFCAYSILLELQIQVRPLENEMNCAPFFVVQSSRI